LNLSEPKKRSRWRALLALAIAMVMFTAACGDDSESGGSTTGGTDSGSQGGDGDGGGEGDVDATGIVRVEGLLTETDGAQFDPTTSSLTGDEPWMAAIYGSLLEVDQDGEIVPYLAESYEVVDPTTVEISLREGMTFSDGESFDAEAVRAGLLRTKDQPASDAVEASRTPGFKAMEDVEVVDPLTIRVSLNAPIAGQFLIAMTSPRESAIPSPAAPEPSYPDVEPVGAGPFVLDQFNEGQSIRVVKNESFFDAESWQLGGIEWVQTTPGPTQTTGLLSGALDFTRIQASDLPQVEAAGNYTTESFSAELDYASMLLCTTKPPLDDPRVRRAINLAINRDQLNDLWQGGLGEPQLGPWPKGHPNELPGLSDLVKYDPDEARSLLEDAGATAITMDMYWTEGVMTAQTVEVVQANLADVGITVNPVNSPDTVADFIEPQKPGIMLNRATRIVENQMAATLGGGLITLCGAEFPEAEALMAEAAKYNRLDPEATAAWHEIGQILADESLYIFLVTMPRHWTWNTDVVGGEPRFNPMTGQIDFRSIYVKQ
jgi:ABC-type transport system substrate-binding protein